MSEAIGELKWTVEIVVADDLVAEGLEITERVVHDALTRRFPFATTSRP